jgi:hypothetical protein
VTRNSLWLLRACLATILWGIYWVIRGLILPSALSLHCSLAALTTAKISAGLGFLALLVLAVQHEQLRRAKRLLITDFEERFEVYDLSGKSKLLLLWPLVIILIAAFELMLWVLA